nr:hypothetical protein [Tanacetum cinerariifolium]
MNQNLYNSNSSGFDQTQPSKFPVVHPPPQETSIEISHDQENVINFMQTFLRKFNRYSFFETPKVLLLAWDRVFEIKDAFENNQYKPEDIQELFCKLLDNLQNIHEELAEFINSPGWNRPAVYDDDDDDVDYTIAIIPVLSTEEPDNSLSMGDEHLDTILAMESDEVMKSSVKDLVSIPSEFKGIPDTMCDVHLVNNPTPLEAKDHFEIVINSNDDYSSSDDDSLYYENIEYVEASPHDYEFVSLEVEKIVISEDEEIEDDNLREKLLKINLLIAKIKALKDNPTQSSEFLTKSSSTSPKPFLEGTNTFHNSLHEFENFCFDLEEISCGSTTTHSDISLPEYEALSFYDDHIEEISSGSTTTQSDISLPEYDSFIFDLSNDQFPHTDRSDLTHEEFCDEPAHIISSSEYDCFYFGNLPDPGELISSLNSRICENLSSTTCNRPAFYNNGDDDDVDYTIVITPILSTEESDNSLSMGDEHLDTEGIPDTMCDVHLVNNPTPLEAKDHFEIVINSNDDYSSSDDDSLYNENIEYVDASPYDSELVSLDVAEIVILEDEEIEDVNLREKLLKVNLLIAKIKALKDNSTPSSEFLTKSSSTFPKSVLEETNTFDDSLPEFENFCFDLEEISSSSTTTHSDMSLPDYAAFSFYDDHIEEISSGSTTTHSDISLSEYDSFNFDLSNDQFTLTDRSDSTHEEFADELAHIISPPEYDCFYFRKLPDPSEWISSLNSGIRENLSSTTHVNLP